MTWIASLLKALPAIVALIRELIRFLELSQKNVNSAKRARDFNAAIKKAKDTNDTGDVERFFNGM